LPEDVNRRLHILSRLLEWTRNPQNSFETRLAIESLINSGVAKVPGAIKGKRCKHETIAKRVEIETEIARLWEGVNRGGNLLDALMEVGNPSDHLRLIRDILLGLLESYRNPKRELEGEFAKRLSLAAGVWADPLKLTEDITCVIEHMDASRPTSFGAVQLMTMRRAKGLEADVVIMAGLEDDIIPNPASSTTDEEARLFYVSMTRATERLYMLHSYLRPRNISFGPEVTGKVRSRFLDAIGKPSKYMKEKPKTS
jgi:superfamily I DNA/RNA helicase